MTENENVSAGEAQEALESVAKMESAGWRRAVPGQWFGVGMAALIASMFAIYALEDPYAYIVFPIIGIGVLIAASREKVGAYGRDFPESRANKWTFALFIAVMLVVFFGSIVIRRAYEAAWVSIVAGLLVGVTIFWMNERARRAYIAKAGGQEE